MKNLLFLLSYSSVFSFCDAQINIAITSRSFHPTNSKDTLSTIRTAKVFGASSVEWMYCDNKESLQQLQALNIPYSLAINPQIPDSAGYTTAKTRIKDVNGVPLTAPWMKNWKVKNPYWGCVNNPLFNNVFSGQTKKLVDLGAYAILVDDARFNDHAKEWGGCYCNYCISAFNTYLSKLGKLPNSSFDYRILASKPRSQKDSSFEEYKKLFGQFQTESVINFLTTWITEIKKYSPRSLNLYTNNYNGDWNSPIYKLFDGGISEIPSGKDNVLSKIPKILSTAKTFDKKEILAYASDDFVSNCKFSLHTYLNNGVPLIPWDVLVTSNIQNSQSTRYYKKKDDYVTLFNFIQSHSALFKEGAESNIDSGIKIKNEKGCYSSVRKDASGTYIFLYSDVGSSQKNATARIVLPNGLALKSAEILGDFEPKKLQQTDAKTWIVNYNCSILKVIE